MAYKIDENICIGCGACQAECPREAINEKGQVFEIDPAKCDECANSPDGPACANVCPVDACVPGDGKDLREKGI